MRNNDDLIKRRAREDAFETADRRNNEPKLAMGRGHVVKGHILDCNRKMFERALTAYWDRLFVGWNPYKKDGWGCWEVWQKPIKSKKLSNFEHWVADLDFLSLDFIGRLREMDAWANKDLVKSMDDKYDDIVAKAEKDEDESIKYAVRHNKKEFAKLKELAGEGYNPLWFFSDKGQGRGSV